MDMEISISGPAGPVSKLHAALKSYQPVIKQEKDRSRLIIHSAYARLDQDLSIISRRVRDLEAALVSGENFEFQVRNTACCEPPHRKIVEPYQPVTGLFVRLFDPSKRQETDDQTVLLASGQAFGTGIHPTTGMCLKALHRMAKHLNKFNRFSVLDFGCGTGLLAIAALRFGAARAVGVDIDHQAILCAEKNRKINSLADSFEIVQGSWDKVRGRFDLIIFNTFPSLILNTGQKISLHLRKRGRAVISGFSADQSLVMKEFFSSTGLEPVEKKKQDGWACMVFRKQSKTSFAGGGRPGTAQ